jgi:NADH-quinone oxidoreductase subunit L
MPFTFLCTVIGGLALAGVPPFSGFFSKDEILLYAWGSGGTQGKLLWAVGLVTALLTAFYMSRQVFMVFFGEPRWNEEPATVAGGSEAAADDLGEAATPEPTAAAGHDDTGRADVAAGHAGAAGHGGIRPHESPWLMTLPLVVLAVLAAVGEVINLPFTSDLHFLEHWLHPVIGENELHIDVATGTKVGLAVVAIIAAVSGILVASLVYLRRRVRAVEPAVLAHGWYYDESVTRFVGGPGTKGFGAVAWFDRTIIDGAVNGIATVVRTSGRGLRTVQSGFVRSYALGISAGVVVVLGYFLTRLYV